LPRDVAAGREVDHSLPSSVEFETEMNDTSSASISVGSLKGYMCLMGRKKNKCGDVVYNHYAIVLYYEIKAMQTSIKSNEI
jgi:hypothetical protein